MNLGPHLLSGILTRVATTAGFLSITLLARAADPVPGEVTAALKRSADWHLANPSGIEIRNWIIAPLYDGLLRTALTTGDAKYLAAVIRFGNQEPLTGPVSGSCRSVSDRRGSGR